jgi:hypothetical protein
MIYSISKLREAIHYYTNIRLSNILEQENNRIDETIKRFHHIMFCIHSIMNGNEQALFDILPGLYDELTIDKIKAHLFCMCINFNKLVAVKYDNTDYYKNAIYRDNYNDCCRNFNTHVSRLRQLIPKNTLFDDLMNFNKLSNGEGTISPMKPITNVIKNRPLLNTDQTLTEMHNEGNVVIIKPDSTPKLIAVTDVSDYFQYIMACICTQNGNLHFDRCNEKNQPVGPHTIVTIDGNKYFASLDILCNDPIDGKHGILNSCSPKVISTIMKNHIVQPRVICSKSIVQMTRILEDPYLKKKNIVKRYVDYYRAVMFKIRDLLLNEMREKQQIYPIMCCGCLTLKVVAYSKHNEPYKCKNYFCELHGQGICMKCNQTFHNDTPCDQAMDEATQKFIQETSKPCPRCDNGVHKIDGCNHMTCVCSTQFCYQCGNEFDKENGSYKISEHYDNEISRSLAMNGLIPERLCQQFS